MTEKLNSNLIFWAKKVDLVEKSSLKPRIDK